MRSRKTSIRKYGKKNCFDTKNGSSSSELNLDDCGIEDFDLQMNDVGKILKHLEELIRRSECAEEELRRLHEERCNSGQQETASNCSSTDDLAGIFRNLATSMESAISTKQMRFDEVEKSFKTFDGSDGASIVTWINKFIEQADLLELDSFQRFAYAKRLMRKTAKLFVDHESKATTWTGLQCELRNEFANKINSAIIHRQLCERRKKKMNQLLSTCTQ